MGRARRVWWEKKRIRLGGKLLTRSAIRGGAKNRIEEGRNKVSGDLRGDS